MTLGARLECWYDKSLTHHHSHHIHIYVCILFSKLCFAWRPYQREHASWYRNLHDCLQRCLIHWNIWLLCSVFYLPSLVRASTACVIPYFCVKTRGRKVPGKHAAPSIICCLALFAVHLSLLSIFHFIVFVFLISLVVLLRIYFLTLDLILLHYMKQHNLTNTVVPYIVRFFVLIHLISLCPPFYFEFCFYFYLIFG